MFALSEYLHDHDIPVGLPGSDVTLIDTSYKGTLQELLSAAYPETRFTGRYAFLAESPRDPHPGSKTGYALHLRGAHSNNGLPTDRMPADETLTFAHQDAIGSVEGTLHGPYDSPKRFVSGLVWQQGLRFEDDPLDGLNPQVVSTRLRDPLVREGVKHVNLLALHHFARDATLLRDRRGDFETVLVAGAERFRTKVRAWITGRPTDPALAEMMMDGFVRRTDKGAASALSRQLRHDRVAETDAAAVWTAFGRCSTDADKQVFVDNYRTTRWGTAMTDGGAGDGRRRRTGLARNGRPERES